MIFRSDSRPTAAGTTHMAACLALAAGLFPVRLAADGPDAPNLPAEPQLLEQVSVPGPDILLRDLVADAFAWEGESWLDLKVADAAGYGLARLLDGRTLLRGTRGKTPESWFEGTKNLRVRIETRSDSLPTPELDSLLEAFFAAREGKDGERLTWEILRRPDRIDLPLAAHSRTLRFASAKERGRTTLYLDIASEPWPVRSYPLLLQVSGHRPVRVTTRRVERGETLDAANTRVEIREVTAYHRQGLPAVDAVIGMRAVAPLQAGRVITDRRVESQPLVRKGETASLVWTQGTVRVTAAAVCRESGAAGDVISVRNLVTSRMGRARVLSDGTLEPLDG